MSSVILRALEPEDLDWLYTIENDTAIWDVADCPQHYSRYDLRRYIAEQPRNAYESGEVRLVIADAQTGQGRGLVDLVNFSPVHRRAEVSIALLQAFRGKGYGASALLQLEDYARRYLHVRMLYAHVAVPRNLAAISLFRSAGYVATALLPEWHCNGEEREDVQVMQKNLEKIV